MGASLEICSRRSVIAVLASGVVISLTALTGGLAPAYAKPNTDTIAPTTTTVPVPEPKVKASDGPTAADVPPPTAPVTLASAPPSVASPPPTQSSEPPPVTVQTTTVPRVVASSTTEPSPVTTTAQSPMNAAPARPSVTVATSESPTPAGATSVPPSAALVAPPSEGSQVPASASPSTATDTKTSGAQRIASVTPSSSSTVSQAAKVIETEQPQTLQAPKADIELARNANPIEQKPDPAPKQDVDSLASSLNLNLGGRDGAGVSANADVRLASERVFDHPVRQWSPDWVQYDEYYRPVLLNPYHDPVRIVYVYQDAPRIVWIPPLARIVLDVAEFAAYSFTAVVATAADIVDTAAQTAVDAAVGTFFGGGFDPGLGLPLPPPPPVLRYDNVPVQVRYSDATYEPFRVQRVVDVGDDPRYGERKVLLDGATPAWGVWTQAASGERQFEVHRTQQFPGLDDPQEAPLPGDYQMTLASDNTPSGLTSRDIFLIVTAAVIAILGFGAIGMSIYLGRRRPRH